MKKHKNGFTLAEVLITLVIIGIIAAMTIPTLMNKTNEQETVVAVKKAYSILGQAYQRMVAENGEINPSYFGSTDQEATKNFGDIFIKYFNVQKVCGTTTGDDCWSTENGGEYKFFDGSYWYNWNSDTLFYKIRFSDGMAVGFRQFLLHDTIQRDSENIQTCGNFYVDVNGDKGPNTLGKDVFTFHMTNIGILPYGLSSTGDTQFSTCRTTGRGCTAWVVTKGNMDYLHKEVSW